MIQPLKQAQSIQAQVNQAQTIPAEQATKSKKPAIVLSEAEQRRLKLQKATQAFEAIFISKLLKNMHSVSLNKEDSGFGKDIMMEMADESVSQQLAKTGKFGIGKMLFKHLSKKLDETVVKPNQIKIGKPDYRPKDAVETHAGTKATEAAHRVSKAIRMDHPNLIHHSPISIKHEPASIKLTPEKTSLSTATQKAEPLPQLKKYADHIKEAATASNLPENLLQSMIMHESGGDASAVSAKGAKGLMQLMPDTAKAVGVQNPLDPKENILGGARYLRSLLNRFGDLKTALAAYNAGPGNVIKHGGIPPFAETIRYVEKVISDISGAK